MSLCHWRTSRERYVLDELLRGGMSPEGGVYGGAIISDGYEGYASWMRSLPEEQRPQWQACWAHVRRKFVEAARTGSDPEWSRRMVQLIPPLCRIEKELRESKAPPEAMAEKREAESPPIVEALFAGLQERMKQSENLPVNTLRRATLCTLVRECQRVKRDVGERGALAGGSFLCGGGEKSHDRFVGAGGLSWWAGG